MIIPTLAVTAAAVLTASPAITTDLPPRDQTAHQQPGGAELERSVVFTESGPALVLRVPETVQLLMPDFEVTATSAEEIEARQRAAEAERQARQQEAQARELARHVQQLRDDGLVVSESGWVRPVTTYTVTSTYGSRGPIPAAGVGAMFHNGIDLAAPARTPIHAPFDGTVTYAGWGHPERGNTGWLIELTHTDGTQTMYNHMWAPSHLEAGDVVSAGDQIGGIGSTGHSSGDHLHLTTWVDGEHVDPESYFAERGITLR